MPTTDQRGVLLSTAPAIPVLMSILVLFYYIIINIVVNQTVALNIPGMTSGLVLFSLQITLGPALCQTVGFY